jgi:hypothetical protein
MLEDTGIKIEIDVDQVDELEPERTVRCKSCEHEITKPSLAIEPHEHTFRNPFGISYHIACYSDAPGAIDLGTPSMVATWFPKYAWSFAQCGQCKSHIGWWFQGPDKFVGLIVSMLIR